MGARRSYCPLEGHVTVQNIENGLQCGTDDAWPARGPYDQNGTVTLEDNGWGHAAQGSFLGLKGVCLGTDQPIDIRHPRVDGEIIHLVVKDDACPRD